MVTRDVAVSLQKKLQSKGIPIERVRFEFKSISGLSFTNPSDNAEVWDKVGKLFDVRFDGTTFVMEHFTPTAIQSNTTFTADITGNIPTSGELLNNIFSLSELLVLYQDSRTIIIAVPQPQIYALDSSKLDKLGTWIL